MKRWIQYAKPYWYFFVFGPVMMIVEVVGEVVMPKLFANIIDQGVALQDTAYITREGLFMILTAVLMMVGGTLGCYFGAKGSTNLAADVRRDCYAKIQTYSFENIDRFSTGSLVTRLTNDVTQIQNFTMMLLRMCLRAPGMMIGAIFMAVRMNARLALVLAVVMPIMIVIIAFTMRAASPRFKQMQGKIDNLNTNIQENLTNVRVVKSFVREDYQYQKFTGANEDLRDTALSAMKLVITILPILSLLMDLAVLAVIWFGGRSVLVGSMEIGDLSAFITYINQILMSLMMLSMIFLSASRASASSRRLAEVLDEKVTLTDENAAYPDRKVEQGQVEFRNVSFRYYKNSEEKVLDDINLTIGAGQTVGIIGSTGCGKTTLVSMIPRLYDADEGEVLVDGINVKDYSLYNLREGVGMVLQKNVLFSGTIAENLRWGDADATDEELRQASDVAQADLFIREFKEGYDRELGQGGVNVSGGQKQRLCIARALLKKPKILILDDSTSAVDTATEANIRRRLKEEHQTTTTIIIAQRISSVMDADEIIVMDDGKIVGQGTHDQLLKTNETYQEIYESQAEKLEVTA